MVYSGAATMGFGKEKRLSAGAVLTGATLVILATMLAQQIKDARNQRRELRKMNAQMAEFLNHANKTMQFSRAVASFEPKVAFSELPDGLAMVGASEGVSEADLHFVRRFRSPLLPATSDLSDVRSKIYAALVSEFPGYRDLMAERLPKLTERERFLAFALARTNGSLPTYVVRRTVPDDLGHLVTGIGGNCADVTLRMMLVAEALGLKAMSISITTTSIPGHFVVDAYDPESNAAYIFDATFNVLAISRNTDGRSLLEGLYLRGGAAGSEIELFQLPVYFRFVDPGDLAFGTGVVTARSLNMARSETVAKWRKFLVSELGELRALWETKPRDSVHLPATLRQWRKVLKSIPAAFDGSEGFENGLRVAVGIALPVAAADKPPGDSMTTGSLAK